MLPIEKKKYKNGTSKFNFNPKFNKELSLGTYLNMNKIEKEQYRKFSLAQKQLQSVVNMKIITSETKSITLASGSVSHQTNLIKFFNNGAFAICTNQTSNEVIQINKERNIILKSSALFKIFPDTKERAFTKSYIIELASVNKIENKSYNIDDIREITKQFKLLPLINLFNLYIAEHDEVLVFKDKQ